MKKTVSYSRTKQWNSYEPTKYFESSSIEVPDDVPLDDPWLIEKIKAMWEKCRTSVLDQIELDRPKPEDPFK